MNASKPVSNLSPQDWMKDPKTRAVMDALGADDARFVGGCVRNALLGAPVDDIDIATIHTPDVVTQKLEAAGIKAVPTGIEHGTVTAVLKGKPFEITTLRKDVQTDGRRAVVAFSTDWGEDASRRDFTMNALFMDQAGNVYDPLGQGLDDLRARRVTFVGEPADRIAEDHLRILRYFRFHALYARGEPDQKALAACKNAADKISSLSRERITQEVFKILSVENPVSVLQIMHENGITPEFFTADYNPDFLTHLCNFQTRYNLAFVASRLLALAGLKAQNVERFESLLLIPKVFKKDMQAISAVLALPDLKDDHAVKVAVYKYGRLPTAQALMIELAQDRVISGYAPTALKIVQKWDIPDFPISGEDLMKEGFKPGSELGAELDRRETAWIENGFK